MRLRGSLTSQILYPAGSGWDGSAARPAQHVTSPLKPAPSRPETLPDYLGALRRRRLSIALFVVGGIGCGIGLGLLEKPEYQSQASLEVQTVNENFMDAREVSPTNGVGEYSIEPYVRNQAELIRNESLLGHVVDSLHLWGVPGLPKSRTAAIRMCMANLSVRPIAQTRVIRLAYDSPDPQRAAAVVNAVADQVIQQNIDSRRREAERTTKWLNDQAAALKSKLEASENELQQYARRSGLSIVDDKNNVEEDKLRNLQQELSKAQADRIAKQSLFEMASSSAPDALPQDTNDGQLQAYQAKLTELRRQRADLATLLTDQNYKVRRLDAQIAELQKAIQHEMTTTPERIRNEYQAALDRESLLSKAYLRQAALVADQSASAIHYSTLMREVETTRALQAQMVQRAGEAELNAGMPRSNIHLMAPASIPLRPYKPNMLLNAALGLITGLFFGLTFAGAKELRDRTFKAPGELAQSLQIAELGAIPAAHCDPGVPTRKFLRTTVAPVETVTHHHSQSLMAESFRATLASLFLTGPHNDAPKVIVVTSAGPNEGKTTLVSNLGLAFAQVNRSVLLVNADLRKTRLHEVFHVDRTPGIADLLADRHVDLRTASLDHYVRSTDIQNLYLLPSGSETENINAVLQSDRLAALFSRLRREFDLVVVDTPPALQIADARLLARVCDGVVLVARAGHTTRSAATALAHRFEMDQMTILGVILNDWNPSEGDADNSRLYLDVYRHYYSASSRGR